LTGEGVSVGKKNRIKINKSKLLKKPTGLKIKFQKKNQKGNLINTPDHKLMGPDFFV